MKKSSLIIGRRKRSFYLIARRLLAAVSAGVLLVLLNNSRITVECNGRTYSQSIVPFEQRAAFEESELFHDILREEVRGITRMAVIRSQLETDGVYNGQRQIDIAQYAHRQEELPDTNATALFFLDDLVKWGNFGFVTETVYGTEAELNSYFQNGFGYLYLQEEFMEQEVGISEYTNAQSGSVLSRMMGGPEDTLSMRMIAQLPSSREEYMSRAEAAGLYVQEDQILELNILVPRYLSAEDKDLAEYASSVEEYVRLREDLKTTSKELFYNYSEYSENKGFLAADRTNIRYCYRMSVDGEVKYFTNLQGNLEEKKLDEITGIFQQLGPYVYYNGDRSEIDTNTALTADEMKQELSSYQYAFEDNTRVWIAVDTDYASQDAFTKAKEAFESLMPFYWYLAAAFGVMALLSLLLLIRLTAYEGRVLLEDGENYQIVLHRADRMRTEPFFLLSVLVLGGIGYGCYLGYLFCQVSWEDALHSNWMPVAVGTIVFFADYAAMFFYLGLVRRIKARTIWKNSLLNLLVQRAAATALSLYDNGHILLRSLIPFMALLLANLILGACGVWGILLAALLDVFAILVLYQEKRALEEILESTVQIGQGDFERKINAERMHGENRALADAVNGLGDGIKKAVEQSMKDERLKADLITNVSHDIKTPLTSIINFVNLLKRERIEDERIRGYISVLDAKSQRLKQLTDDLVEASKISSGNINLQMERLNFTELVHQTCGEFSDKFREKCLEMVLNLPEKPVYIEADSRRIWRVVDNLFTNVYKYALEGTRVYLDVKVTEGAEGRQAVFSMKNISAQSLNIDARELTERFIRGDISRSTEGSGLGLSIAKNLTQLQGGKFDIYLDGDLFKAILTFPSLEEEGGQGGAQ